MAAPMTRCLFSKQKYLVSIYSHFVNRSFSFRGFLPNKTTIDLKRPGIIHCVAFYAKKAGKAQPAPVIEEEPIEVNKNPEDLVKYCVGSNYLKEGSDVELKPDSEYPDWLWNLHIGPPKKLEELDPDSKEYWKKLRRLNMKRNNRLAKLRKF